MGNRIFTRKLTELGVQELIWLIVAPDTFLGKHW